jgi:hypothetical protein
MFPLIQGVPGGMCQTWGGCPYVKIYRYNPKHVAIDVVSKLFLIKRKLGTFLCCIKDGGE